MLMCPDLVLSLLSAAEVETSPGSFEQFIVYTPHITWHDQVNLSQAIWMFFFPKGFLLELGIKAATSIYFLAN